MQAQKLNQSIYILGSTLFVIGLPVSNYLISVSLFLLSLNWAAGLILDYRQGRLGERFSFFRKRKSLLILISIYLVHIIWMFNTSDFSYGLRDLRIKLPLLLLPLIYGTSARFSRQIFKLILLAFVGTVIVNSFITCYVLFGFSKLDPVDSRDASIFISHIRFSLMVVLSLFTLFYLLTFQYFTLKNWEKPIYIISLIWLIGFLVILQSFTGIIIFLLLVPGAILWWAYHHKRKGTIRWAYALSLLIIGSLTVYLIHSYNRFNYKVPVNLDNLDRRTANGNLYYNCKTADEYENGYRIWLYICEKELKQEWNKRSAYNFKGFDRKGQKIQYTLIRYMTSLGLRKDSAGISQLSQHDIEMIEKGYANYVYTRKFALYPRIYETLWQLDRYRKTGDPSGQSLGQRIEYFEIGLHIFKRFFWQGTGTGDIPMEFSRQYELDHSLLKPEWRHRAHNQYLTFFISFGIFGGLWVLFALVAPVFLERKQERFLLMIFLAIALLSMINEDTLETHVGVSFFSFFYAFLLYAWPGKDPESHEKTES